jgi:ATP-dependent Clp protease ATP-binding subunit ClpA
MFERFTNRARHVVVLAQEEARLLNHNYIGTEHLLLGLLGEPESIAGIVLTNFGITLDLGRREVEERIHLGKKAPSGHIPFTPRAKKTLELSLREALSLGHNYIGTEHILLGLIRENEGVAVQILRAHTDLAQLRAAVIEAVPEGTRAAGGAELAEGAEETNAVLRWLRQRLSRHGSSVPLRTEVLRAEPARRGTPAVEAALQQAARLAGPRPVGSHHLLLAAMEDTNSAASWALASLGVDLDELREKLRTAKLTGTSDEPPEQAGRRQMAVQVTDEILTVVLTDPVIVEAGKEALRAVNARAAAARSAGQAPPDDEAARGPAAGEDSPGEEAGGESATATVIRGDNPHAAGLADVWLELHKTLSTLADPQAARRVAIAARPPTGTGPAEPAGESEPEEPDAPEAAIS